MSGGSNYFETVRPMRPGDYAAGYAVEAPACSAVVPGSAGVVVGHPYRDAMIGAVIAATALYIVPKVLEYAADHLGMGEDPDDYQLEVEG